jgi:hypothetical protein
MSYRCQRFNSKPIQRLKRVQKERSKGNRSAPWSGAPDCRCATGQCLVHHRIVSDAPGAIHSKLFGFEFLRRSSAIIHQTVWCTTGLSGVPAEQRLSARNGRLFKGEQCNIDVRAEGQRGTKLSGVAPDCSVPHEDKASNGRLAPYPNDRVMWRRTGHCPVRPPPAAFSNGYNLVGGYKYHPNRPLQGVGVQATFQVI